MPLSYPILLFTFCLNLLMGFAVYLQSEKNKSRISFFTISGGLLLWSGALLLFSIAENPESAILYSKIAYFSAIIIALAQVNFAVLYGNVKQIIPVRLYYFNLASLLFALIGLFTNYLISGFESYSTTDPIINFGPLYPVYSIIIIVAFGYGLYTLFLKYKIADTENVKQQIVYIFFGMLIPIIGGVATNLLLPVLSVFSFYWLGPVFTLIMVAFISLAILRHHLFNIKAIATELLTFGLWVFILIRTLFSNTYEDALLNSLLLLLTIIVGTFLIRSVIREVETREKMEDLAAQLSAANEQLQELDRQKSEFVSIASHQLRSPLTAIKGYSSMLLEGSFGKMTKKIEGAVRTIFDSSQSLVVVIDNFLNLSRIEQGRMTYDFVDIELKEYVRGIVNQLLPNAEKKGLMVTYEAPEKIDFTVKIDPDKMRQVILNLIDNSIKYTPAGWIKVSLNRTVGGLITLTVSDNGIGMSEKTINKLFKKFSRAENAGKTNATGSGLGMYLASEIMKAHGGTVHAESEGEGMGSQFIVEFGTPPKQS